MNNNKGCYERGIVLKIVEVYVTAKGIFKESENGYSLVGYSTASSDKNDLVNNMVLLEITRTDGENTKLLGGKFYLTVSNFFEMVK